MELIVRYTSEKQKLMLQIYVFWRFSQK